MSDQSPDRPRRRPRNRPAAGGPHRWSRTSLVVAGTTATAVVVSVGLVVAGGGHSADASLSSKVTTPTNAPLTPAPESSSSATSSSSAASSSSPAKVSARTSSPPPSPAQVKASAQASSPPSASAPWVSTSCPSQLLSWRSTGAGGQLQVVVTKLTIVSQAAMLLHADLAAGTAPAAAVTALRSAAASLSSATQAAEKNMIPGCVSGAHQAEVAGLADLDHAVTGFGSAADKSDSGDFDGAQGGMQAAVTAMQSGSAEVATAIVAVGQYGTR